MREQFRPIVTNLTPVNVIGVPGLMLVLIAIALAFQFPEARWLIACGLAGGACIAVLLIKRRQHRSSDDDDLRSHGMLALEERRPPRDDSKSPHSPHGGAPLWAPARSTV
jgi:hypothetical protein